MLQEQNRPHAEKQFDAAETDSATLSHDGDKKTERRQEAIETFRTPPFNHNCAQAIAYRWQELFADKEIVTTYAPYVGGHAPKGYCGALYAAMNAVPAHSIDIKRDFQAACGGIYCREIKRTSHTPCEICVATASRLVDKYRDKRT